MKVFLIGNPNSGKTSLFNALTGSNVKIGNWPGVTVEKREGFRQYGDIDLAIMDLPGAYSLNPFTPEERIVTECLDEAAQGQVVNILDCGNLERNLLMSFQLMELGIRPILVLNCFDEFSRGGGTLHLKEFRQILGCSAYVTVASRQEGIEPLLDGIAVRESGPAWQLDPVLALPAPMIQACDGILSSQGKTWKTATPLQKRDALNTLLDPGAGDDSILRLRNGLIESLEKSGEKDVRRLGLSGWLAGNRYGRISRLVSQCVSRDQKVSPDRSDFWDSILLHRFWGMPLFFLIMGLMFWVTFSLGGIPADGMKRLLDGVRGVLLANLPGGLLTDLAANGILAGVGGVLVFLPNVVILFLCMGLLEDSGYMARVAFLMDRPMRLMGLHGNGFIPMIMGFGCNVPAIMGTRILASRRQRLQLMFTIPLVGCSARLPVFLLLTGVFFPEHPSAWLSAFFSINVGLILMIGLLSGKIYQNEADSHFVLEMPPYRFPVLKNVLSQLSERAGHFVQKAGTIILAGTILVWYLQSFPREVPLSREFDKELAVLRASGQSPEKKGEIAQLEALRDHELFKGRYMSRLGNLLLPVVAPLGFGWREAVSLIPGFLAKESIVSTLSVLYAPVDPDFGVAMKKEGMTPIAAFAFMIFTLLYVPCLATLGVIWKESGSLKFTVVAAVLPAVMAWMVAFGAYRIGLIFGYS